MNRSLFLFSKEKNNNKKNKGDGGAPSIAPTCEDQIHDATPSAKNRAFLDENLPTVGIFVDFKKSKWKIILTNCTLRYHCGEKEKK